MNIVSRSQWGARPAKSRVTGDTVSETFLHHTAGAHSGAAGVRSIQSFHMDQRGWSDIAYNFLVDSDTLTVFEGRGWGVRPGSQKSYNTGTWSVCVLGNFQTERPSPQLLETIAELIRFGHELGHLPLELTGGHRDAPGQSTTCPGQHLHREIPTIRNLLEDDMPLSPEDLEAVRQILWFNADMHDYTTGQDLHAATLLRHARNDAFEARVDSTVTRKLIEKIAPASGVAITQADIDAISADVVEELKALRWSVD